MPIFYHASPNRIPVGETLRLTKKEHHPPDLPPHACLARNIPGSIYWAGFLKAKNPNSLWFIHAVEVPEDAMVYDCRTVYFFENPSRCRRVRAGDVDRQLRNDFDGEIVVTEPIARVIGSAPVFIPDHLQYPDLVRLERTIRLRLLESLPAQARFEFPDFAGEAAEKIAASGGRLYAVGGSVRDAMMGLPAKDHDFSVVGLTPEQFARLFPQATVKGKDFPVFEWQGAEFALARTEKKFGRGHRGFVFHADPSVTIEDDLRRRDFTINAIAVDVLTGEVVDPFGGLEDLRHGRLRAISDAFLEDPLRAYRAARFSASLGFDVTPETIDLMRRTKPELASLSPERVFDELRKALRTERPSPFFRTLADAGILDVHFPELDALRGVPQPAEHHPEGDAFEHTMQVLDAMARLTDDEALRWAAAVHDVGKGITPRERWPHHYGHEEAGVPLVEELGKRLALPGRWTEVAREGTAWHMRAYRIDEMRLGKKVRFIEDLARSRIGVEGMALLVTADHRGRDHPDVHVREADSLRHLARTVLSVRGDHIDAPPGPGFREKLTQARIRYLQELQKGLAEFEMRAPDSGSKGRIRAPNL